MPWFTILLQPLHWFTTRIRTADWKTIARPTLKNKLHLGDCTGPGTMKPFNEIQLFSHIPNRCLEKESYGFLEAYSSLVLFVLLLNIDIDVVES